MTPVPVDRLLSLYSYAHKLAEGTPMEPEEKAKFEADGTLPDRPPYRYKAVRAALKAKGYHDLTVYTPVPVHEIEDVVRRPRSSAPHAATDPFAAADPRGNETPKPVDNGGNVHGSCPGAQGTTSHRAEAPGTIIEEL